MIKINGLDKLTREINDAQKAMSELGEELVTVSIDYNDPASIEAAIQQVEFTIDERLGRHSSNSIIGPLIEEMKQFYREGIIDKAAEARVGDNSGDE